MKISFIIPVYNCKTYLPACVESIRAVNAEDYEILLIDDGSTDGSGPVCDDLAGRFSEVRVVHQANAGASAARNRGIQEAEGELLLFIDADDSIDSAALGQVLSDQRCMENDLTIFGLTFDYYHNGKCYRQDPLFFELDGSMDQKDWGSAFVTLFRDNSLSPVWNKVFKREIIHTNALALDTSMFLYEDFEFVLRYMRCCDTIWNVPQAIYHYRQSEDEGNAGRRLKRIDSLSQFLVPIEDALEGLKNVPDEKKNTVLVQLHQTIAREKIMVSDLKGIKRICREYTRWYRDRKMSGGQNELHHQMMEGKAAPLLLQSKKTALRHKIAVWVKAHLYKMRNRNGQ